MIFVFVRMTDTQWSYELHWIKGWMIDTWLLVSGRACNVIFKELVCDQSTCGFWRHIATFCDRSLQWPPSYLVIKAQKSNKGRLQAWLRESTLEPVSYIQHLMELHALYASQDYSTSFTFCYAMNSVSNFESHSIMSLLKWPRAQDSQDYCISTLSCIFSAFWYAIIQNQISNPITSCLY